MTPYERFTELCKEKSVTAGRVASATNIDRSTFTHWKYGRSVPKIDKLCKIANYFEVPVTDFIEDYSSSI